ncbi:hypothetical protein MTR67_043853 [Solanum verrucosum]|uniref:Uncharacterized protein n=1 Tax=Solanum verrucosum TaxID=315347 RepID=A0AAF0UPH7_SOLVR|nr:hypothetical protein MTR67_043853 [Solanum verrucosum]
MNSSNFIALMDYFESLLESCKLEIISRTTPADAVRSTILSKGFKFVAESDEIWGNFLPHDYQERINGSKFPLVCNTKRSSFSVCVILPFSLMEANWLGNGCDNSLESVKSSIRFVNYESEIDIENQANTVHLPRLQESGYIPKIRGDGWMKVKLGYFDSKKGTDGPVEERLFEMNHFYKGGLIIEGVEFVQNEMRIWNFKFYKF